MTISDTYPTICGVIAVDFLFFSELKTSQYYLDLVILEVCQFKISPLISLPF